MVVPELEYTTHYPRREAGVESDRSKQSQKNLAEKAFIPQTIDGNLAHLTKEASAHRNFQTLKGLTDFKGGDHGAQY
jgi:hypothetical protein